jgi:hypothetical protein
VLAFLMDGRADPAANGSEVLRRAARKGKPGIVRALLDDGRADPAAKNSQVLWEAVLSRCVAVVQVLLADGRADPAAEQSVALCEAAEEGDVAIVQLLLEDGRADPAMVDAGDCCPLTWVAVAAATRWRQRRLWLRAGSEARAQGHRRHIVRYANGRRRRSARPGHGVA